jgi:hypothetical protein
MERREDARAQQGPKHSRKPPRGKAAQQALSLRRGKGGRRRGAACIRSRKSASKGDKNARWRKLT